MQQQQTAGHKMWHDVVYSRLSGSQAARQATSSMKGRQQFMARLVGFQPGDNTLKPKPRPKPRSPSITLSHSAWLVRAWGSGSCKGHKHQVGQSVVASASASAPRSVSALRLNVCPMAAGKSNNFFFCLTTIPGTYIYCSLSSSHTPSACFCFIFTFFPFFSSAGPNSCMSLFSVFYLTSSSCLLVCVCFCSYLISTCSTFCGKCDNSNISIRNADSENNNKFFYRWLRSSSKSIWNSYHVSGIWTVQAKSGRAKEKGGEREKERERLSSMFMIVFIKLNAYKKFDKIERDEREREREGIVKKRQKIDERERNVRRVADN